MTAEALMLQATQEALVLRASPIITFGYIMQMIFSLAIVLGIIYLCAKFLLPKIKLSGTGKFITVLDRVALEPNVSLYVIQIGIKKWLIGVGQKNITRIEQLDEEK